MTLNCIWYRSFSPGKCRVSLHCHYSTLSQRGSRCLSPIYGSGRSVCRLFVLDKNTCYNCEQKKKKKKALKSAGARLFLCRGLRPLAPTSILIMSSNNLTGEGNAEYLFIAIVPRSTLARSGSTWWGPIYGSNRTVLYAKLNCWNRTVYMYKNGFSIE